MFRTSRNSSVMKFSKGDADLDEEEVLDGLNRGRRKLTGFRRVVRRPQSWYFDEGEVNELSWCRMARDGRDAKL